MCLWWFLYTALAIWAQEWFAGIDFFSPGLIVFLQNKQWKTALASACIWGIMQEGAGSLSFGSVLLFDLGLVGLFCAGTWLFEPENPLYVIVLVAVTVVWRSMVVFASGTLQGLFVSLPSFSFMVLQFVSYAVTWVCIYPLYCRVVSHAQA